MSAILHEPEIREHTKAIAPSCVMPWVANPGRLWSLTDVLRFYATDWFLMVDNLRDSVASSNVRIGLFRKYTIDRKLLRSLCLETSETAKQLGFTLTAMKLDKLADDIEQGQCKGTALYIALEEVLGRLYDESDCIHFFVLPADMVPYYESDLSALFGNETLSAFPGILEDLEEACKCFALQRFTACVFHLMRCLEAVCNALALSLDPNVGKLYGWGDYAKHAEKCMEGKGKNSNGMPSHWPGSMPFFEEALADLRAVYKAFRNPTMHIEKVYTEERAKTIFEASRALIKDIALHVDETGAFAP